MDKYIDSLKAKKEEAKRVEVVKEQERITAEAAKPSQLVEAEKERDRCYKIWVNAKNNEAGAKKDFENARMNYIKVCHDLYGCTIKANGLKMICSLCDN